MNDLKSPGHDSARAVLRIGGPLVTVLGLILMIVGLVSFFSSMGTFEFPRYFWCVFVGLPVLVVGLIMCQFGYLSAIYRYISSETAPVAKDVANYVGEGVKPGVKSVAKAITEGILEAQKDQKSGENKD